MATLLKDIEVGSLVKLNESGSPVDFYVACHDYESDLNGTGRTLLVRKVVCDRLQWNSSGTNSYATSTISNWLNSDYKTQLDTDIQEAIGTTEFYYTPSGTGSNSVETLSKAIFLLSATELCSAPSYVNSEGSVLPIANSLKVAKASNGTTQYQWTRSPYVGFSNYAITINTNGSPSDYECNNTACPRPAFTLDAESAYILNDGTITFNPPIISGEDTDLGAKGRDFTIDYTATTVKGNNPVVTEMLNDTIIRTYTAENGAQQTMTVPMEGLEIGQHMVTISAEYAGGTTDRIYLFTVSAIWLTYSDTELGDKTGNFTIDYIPETYNGVEMTITEILDGEVQRTYTSISGVEQSMIMNVNTMLDGQHRATITAQCGENIATAVFNFNVPAVTLHDGGTIQEFQDETGTPVFPATLARAVFTSEGKSIESSVSGLDFVKGVINPNSYLWRVFQVPSTMYKISPDTTSLTPVSGNSLSVSSLSVTLYYADELNYSVSEGITLKNPKTITETVNSSGGLSTLKGKFWATTATSKDIYYVPEDISTVAVFEKTYPSSTSVYYYVKVFGRLVTVKTPNDYEYIGLVFSNDSSTYPDEDVIDDKYYKLFGNFLSRTTEDLDVGIIELFSYKGTGTYGVDNPCSVTFNKPPKMIMITQCSQYNSQGELEGVITSFKSDQSAVSIMRSDLLTTQYRAGCGFSDRVVKTYGKKSADGKTFYWYSAESAEIQYNSDNYNRVYHGVAFF